MPQAAIRIVDYDPRWRADFARLNIEWLERWFVVEPVDREVLSDPEVHILDDGGRVKELSRMLAGMEDSDTAIAHAEELLATAQRSRRPTR